MPASIHRRRRRESRARRWMISQRRYREVLARQTRAARTAARLGVQLVAWGECPECGCIGAPGHRCDGGVA